MDTQQTPQQNGHIDLSKLDVRQASLAAIGAAAAKAKIMAQKEEREIQKNVVGIIEKQLRKIELKMKHFEELEKTLEKEKNLYVEEREKLRKERLELKSQKISQDTFMQ